MAYSKQTFTYRQVLTAAEANQIETNIADHVHGQDGVSAIDTTRTKTISAMGAIQPVTEVARYIVGIGGTVSKFVAVVGVAPTTGPCCIEVKINNTSLMATLIIASGSTSQVNSSPTITAFAETDYFQIDVTSANNAEDLMLAMVF